MSVLLCVMIMVGWFKLLIILVMVKVLFVFVVFNNVWWVSLVLRLFFNCVIVVGWLLFGLNLEISWKWLFMNDIFLYMIYLIY